MVTGAAGFIGSHLVGKLLELGYSVKALDLPNLEDAINLREFSGKSKIRIYFWGYKKY